MTERYKTRKNIQIFVLVLLLALVVGYTLYEVQRIVMGPKVTVLSPANGMTVSSSTVEVTGTTRNIADISLDDRKIFVDEKGDFSETVLLESGYNAIDIKASDKFGSQTEKLLEVIYKPAMIEGGSKNLSK